MVVRVIQAVAGAGKTYHITHNIGNDERCLYLTFTNGNVVNLQKELFCSEKTADQYIVSTFSKFMIDWCIRPFYNHLLPTLSSFKGFSTIEPVSDSRKQGYVKKQFPGHYQDNVGKLYLNRLSELLVSQSSQLWKQICKRIGSFVDNIIIDEYQDLTGNDFKLVKRLVKQKNVDVTLVGDVYQSGVVNSLRTNKKSHSIFQYSIEESIEEFLKKILGSSKIKVDLSSLVKSRRISKVCANFVSSKLNINIQSQEISEGKLFIIKDAESLKKIMSTKMDVLIYNKRVPHKFNNQRYTTWTYSKGDTYNNVLVVLAKVTDCLIDDSESNKVFNNSTRNKLYVTLTRAQGNLYVVSSELWNSI